MRFYNDENPDETIHVRIGVSSGEPVDEDGDLYGTAVNLASRLCDHAKPDTILVTPIVCDLIEDQSFSFQDRGEFLPKGFSQNVRVSELEW
jgi:class 3 adenylate cyclase